MGWNKDTRMLKQAQDNTYSCDCGHRVRITNKEGKVICNWCGRMIYANKEEKKKNKFKEEMRRLLNE